MFQLKLNPYINECEIGYIFKEVGKSVECVSENILPYCSRIYSFGNSEYYCSKCIEGYYYNTENKKCIDSEIEHCIKAFSKTECDKCEVGYYFDSESKECIHSKVDKCIDPIDEDECFECEHNYEVEGTPNKCVEVEIKDCYDNDGSKCIKCDEGFVLIDNGQCNKCKDKNALKCSPDSKYCYECKNDYYLKNGKCVSSSIKTFIVLFIALLFLF